MGDQVHDPLRAAQHIIGELTHLRGELKSTAEGFAVLDFVQGRVSADVPSSTALDIVEILRGQQAQHLYLNDLVVYWLENYHRAYSRIVMKAIRDDDDSEQMTA